MAADETNRAGPGRALQPSARGSGALAGAGTSRPPLLNRTAEIDIPNAAWSPWTEERRERFLRRPLSGEERRVLEARKREVEPWIAPMRRGDAQVADALMSLLSGYRSLRMSEDEAAMTIDSSLRALETFPAWAVVKACRYMHENGVWRDGKLEKRWPPTDAEIVAAVRDEVRFYADAHRSAVALLSARVEDADARMGR